MFKTVTLALKFGGGVEQGRNTFRDKRYVHTFKAVEAGMFSTYVCSVCLVCFIHNFDKIRGRLERARTTDPESMPLKFQS